jgi:hypothetical protein
MRVHHWVKNNDERLHGLAPITIRGFSMRVFLTSEVARAPALSSRTGTKCIDRVFFWGGGFRIPGSPHRRIPEASLWDFIATHNMLADGLNELLKTKGAEDS